MTPNFIAYAAIAALSFGSIAAAAAPISPRAAVEAACNLQNRAAENKDITAFMTSLAPDFSAKDENGAPVSRTQAKQNMLQLFGAATHISGVTTIQTFVLKGAKAYITTKEHDVFVSTDPQTQKSASLVDDEIDAEVWCKIAGVWKEESDRIISETHQTQPGTQLDTQPGQTT